MKLKKINFQSQNFLIKSYQKNNKYYFIKKMIKTNKIEIFSFIFKILR